MRLAWNWDHMVFFILADLPRRIPWRAECMIAGDTCPEACWVSQYDMALAMTMAISFDAYQV